MNPDNPIFRTPEEEARAEEYALMKGENERLQRRLTVTVSAAFHALLEATAWMGIPQGKRMRFIESHMSNVRFCAENDVPTQQELEGS